MVETKKYFNIRIDTMNSYGAPILVDNAKTPQKRVEDIIGAYKIKYIKGNGENPHYLFFKSSYQIPKDTVASSPNASLENTVNLVKIGKDSKEPVFKAIVDENGNFRVIENKRNIFITEIDETDTKKSVEEAINWKMQQAWI